MTYLWWCMKYTPKSPAKSDPKALPVNGYYRLACSSGTPCFSVLFLPWLNKGANAAGSNDLAQIIEMIFLFFKKRQIDHFMENWWNRHYRPYNDQAKGKEKADKRLCRSDLCAIDKVHKQYCAIRQHNVLKSER